MGGKLGKLGLVTGKWMGRRCKMGSEGSRGISHRAGLSRLIWLVDRTRARHSYAQPEKRGLVTLKLEGEASSTERRKIVPAHPHTKVGKRAWCPRDPDKGEEARQSSCFPVGLHQDRLSPSTAGNTAGPGQLGTLALGNDSKSQQRTGPALALTIRLVSRGRGWPHRGRGFITYLGMVNVDVRI